MKTIDGWFLEATLDHHRSPTPLEQRSDDLLALPDPLARERRRRDAEEEGRRLGGHRLSDHRLSRSWRTEQQNALRRSAETCEQVGTLAGQHHGLREMPEIAPTSYSTCFAYFIPAMSSHRTLGERSNTLSTTLDS